MKLVRDVIVKEWAVWFLAVIAFLPSQVNSSAWVQVQEHKRPTEKLATEYSIKGANQQGTKRHMKGDILDPYSVLGILSFGTFVFSVLYNRYKMKHPAGTSRRPAPGGGGGGGAPPAMAMPMMPMGAMAPAKSDISEEDLIQMLKRASKILSEVVDVDQRVVHNSTSFTTTEADYYDLDFEDTIPSDSE